jgi:hypothetical protein
MGRKLQAANALADAPIPRACNALTFPSFLPNEDLRKWIEAKYTPILGTHLCRDGEIPFQSAENLSRWITELNVDIIPTVLPLVVARQTGVVTGPAR